MNVRLRAGHLKPRRARAAGAAGPAAVAALLLLAVPAPAQDPPAAAAREAQARFERVRVAHAPWGWRTPRTGREEVVGRLVLLDDPPAPWRPPPEAEAVAAARAELRATLERAAAARPADAWIAGQRVWYAVEAGRPEEAIAAAAACGAQRWWCQALLGFVRHAAGDGPGAEAAFDDALALMPPADRARWVDPEPLLDRDVLREWRAAAPEKRAELARRLWWLADPLWSRPGNDRRSEHLARHVTDRILADARTPFALAWGSDLREILLRYGWPTAWERVRGGTGALGAGGDGIVGHDPPGERRFLPPLEVLTDPAGAPPEAWTLDDEGAPATYAPRYAGRFLDLPHQLAVFRRGDRAIVVAGYDLAADTLPPAGPRGAALVVASAPAAAVVARAESPAPAGAIVATVPWAPAVVSLEVAGVGWAARARYGLPLPAHGRPALSDLLLIDGRGPLPDGLPAAAGRARGSSRVAPGERVGLYWEVTPTARGGPVAFALVLSDERGGFWRGLGSALGLGSGGQGTVALEWEESLPDGGAVYPRAVAVTLPDLPDGRYALELEMRLPDSRVLRARRPIEVARRP